MTQTIGRWNYNTRSYDPVEIPEEWQVRTYSERMSAPTTCPHCGRTFHFGDMYTSMEFQTDFGFGYSVCRECYEEEFERRLKYEHGTENHD